MCDLELFPKIHSDIRSTILYVCGRGLATCHLSPISLLGLKKIPYQ